MGWIIWNFVWQYGIGVAAMVAAGAMIFLGVFRTQAIWLISVVAIGMLVFTYGVHSGAKFEKAKWDAAIARVDKEVGNAVSGAKSDIDNGVRDRWDTDK